MFLCVCVHSMTAHSDRQASRGDLTRSASSLVQTNAEVQRMLKHISDMERDVAQLKASLLHG